MWRGPRQQATVGTGISLVPKGRNRTFSARSVDISSFRIRGLRRRTLVGLFFVVTVTVRPSMIRESEDVQACRADVYSARFDSNSLDMVREVRIQTCIMSIFTETRSGSVPVHWRALRGRLPSQPRSPKCRCCFARSQAAAYRDLRSWASCLRCQRQHASQVEHDILCEPHQHSHAAPFSCFH